MDIARDLGVSFGLLKVVTRLRAPVTCHMDDNVTIATTGMVFSVAEKKGESDIGPLWSLLTQHKT